MNKRILYIGGSPCSGKSTIAELISKDFGAYYFKVDDYIDDLISKASSEGLKYCSKSVSMNPEQTWMRVPEVQCTEEFLIYEEISKFVFEKLDNLDYDFIVAEGAAFTPEVMQDRGFENYICMVPSSKFQISHYEKREWVPFVLEGCSDKKLAFDNWMNRDILFALLVREQCKKGNISCIVNDGSLSIEELYSKVKELFNL